MTLEQAIAQWDIQETEKIIKAELQEQPENINLWTKLCLTELQYPYEDYESALKCLAKVYSIDSCNLTALILEAGIKWHSMGYIDMDTFSRLNSITCSDKESCAIVYYLMSLYFCGNNDEGKQKRMIEKSIAESDHFVFPFRDLAKILFSEEYVEDGIKLLKRAVSNVKKVLQPEELYDFTDANTYIAEYITGTTMSKLNFEHLKNLYK